MQDSATPSRALPGAARRIRFAVIVSRFNEAITDALRDGARAALAEAGAAGSDVEVFAVPGAFEIPQAARCAAETGRFDADRLSRLRHSRRDAALRIHLVGGRAGDHGRGRATPACRSRSAC